MRVHKKCQMSVHRDIEKNEKAVFGRCFWGKWLLKAVKMAKNSTFFV